MEESDDVKKINELLFKKYGTAYGRLDTPKFRVVWSTDQTEKRRGTFVKTDNSGNYIGTEEGVREVPKYPFELDRWILEIPLPVPGSPNANELVSTISWEPLYVFKDDFNNFLPLKLWAVEFAIKMQRYAMEKKVRTKEELDEEERKQYEDEVIRFKEYLNSVAPAFDGAIRDGEAVSFGGVKPMESRDEE